MIDNTRSCITKSAVHIVSASLFTGPDPMDTPHPNKDPSKGHHLTLTNRPPTFRFMVLQLFIDHTSGTSRAGGDGPPVVELPNHRTSPRARGHPPSMAGFVRMQF